MKQMVLRNFDITWLPMLALILFCLSFLAYFYWTYKKSNKSFFEKMSNIPLSEPELAQTSRKGESYEL